MFLVIRDIRKSINENEKSNKQSWTKAIFMFSITMWLFLLNLECFAEVALSNNLEDMPAWTEKLIKLIFYGSSYGGILMGGYHALSSKGNWTIATVSGGIGVSVPIIAKAVKIEYMLTCEKFLDEILFGLIGSMIFYFIWRWLKTGISYIRGDSTTTGTI